MITAAQIAAAMAAVGCSGEQIAGALATLDTRSSAAIRQARYREHKASQNVTKRNDVIRNETVTNHNESVTNNASTRAEPLSSLSTPANEKKEGSLRSPRAKRLSDEWNPSEADRQQAVAHLGADRAKVELETFRDYWRAKPDGAKLDWDATWRNWVRKAAQSMPRASPNSRYPQPNPEKSVHAAINRLCENVANGSVIFAERPLPPMLALARDREREEAARLLPPG